MDSLSQHIILVKIRAEFVGSCISTSVLYFTGQTQPIKPWTFSHSFFLPLLYFLWSQKPGTYPSMHWAEARETQRDTNISTYREFGVLNPQCLCICKKEVREGPLGNPCTPQKTYSI